MYVQGMSAHTNVSVVLMLYRIPNSAFIFCFFFMSQRNATFCSKVSETRVGEMGVGEQGISRQ